MRTTLRPGHILGVIALVGVGIGSIAWTGTGYQQNIPQIKESKTDTVPDKSRQKEKVRKDLDKELQELDRAMKEIENVDFKKIQAEIEMSLKSAQDALSAQKIDMKKMQQELQESLKELNSEKIQREIQQAMKEVEKVDMAKVKAELQQSLKELDKIDMQKMKAEIDASMSKINFDELKKEMEKVKEEMEKNKENLKVDMEKARKDIARAKEEIRLWQQMLDEMDKDGLIDTDKDYKIEYKNKELFINGKKQSDQVTEKYRRYFKKDTTIKKEQGNMNINSRDEDEEDNDVASTSIIGRMFKA